MKKIKELIEKFKNWLIRKLGGVPLAEYKWLEQLQVAARSALKSAHKEGRESGKRYMIAHAEIVCAWRKTVQEICRKSENSYYDWSCEYCVAVCDKHDGWCERFHPINKVKHDLEDIGA